jgi:histidinol-phosphatase (PHP family)
MAWFSYHGGHSGQYCRHAKGDLRAVAERAIELGFTHYGLSEHCPRFRSSDLFPEESDLDPAKLAENFERYVEHARALQREFAADLQLLVGFETESLPPGQWPQLMQTLRERHAFDYVVGSVHSVGDITIDYSPERTAEAEAKCGGWDALCIAYFEQVAELASTLRPEVTGHIDLIRRFRGADVDFSDEVWPSIETALHAVKAAGSLLEVNAAPVRRGFGPVYPAPRILERARELAIPVTLGDDSHGPHDVGGGLSACVDALAAAGYQEAHLLEHRDAALRIAPVPLAELKPGV